MIYPYRYLFFYLLDLFIPINSDLANNLDLYQDHQIESIKSNAKNKTKKRLFFVFALKNRLSIDLAITNERITSNPCCSH